jgi:hypothetical protein
VVAGCVAAVVVLVDGVVVEVVAVVAVDPELVLVVEGAVAVVEVTLASSPSVSRSPPRWSSPWPRANCETHWPRPAWSSPNWVRNASTQARTSWPWVSSASSLEVVVALVVALVVVVALVPVVLLVVAPVVAPVVVPVVVAPVGEPLVVALLGSHAAGSVKSPAPVPAAVVVVVVGGVMVVVVGIVCAFAALAAMANKLAAYTADRSERNMPQ